MLTQDKICAKCKKPNCEVLYFDKERKEWQCPACNEKLLKAEKLIAKKLK